MQQQQHQLPIRWKGSTEHPRKHKIDGPPRLCQRHLIVCYNKLSVN
jgi:hypothetical protein